MQLLEGELAGKADEAWRGMVAAAKPSPTAAAVFRTLKRSITDPCYLEHVIEGGLLSVDIAVYAADGTKIAVEVHGPQHFRLGSRVELGSSMMRNRLL